MSNYSEDGGEVPEVIAVRREPGHWNDPLMTVAQHERIVAAKDAEIARLQQFNISLNQENTRLFSNYSAADDECMKLRALLVAQPAHQVGGDADGVRLGIDDRTAIVSQEAYSIVLEREQAIRAALGRD